MCLLADGTGFIALESLEVGRGGLEVCLVLLCSGQFGFGLVSVFCLFVPVLCCW